MINKPSLLDSPNLINAKEYTVSDVPGESVDDCYAKDSLIRGDYDGTDTVEWDTGKLVQETLPAAEWDAFIHDLTGFGWQMTEVVRSIWEEIYCLINGAQVGMDQQAITQLLSGAQTFTNKTISFYDNTLTGVVSVDTAQTLTNKTIAFGSNTLTDVASTNTTQTLTGKTLDLNLDTNKIYVGTANRVLVSDSNKKIVPAADTTDTEIGYVHGVTSAIQTQLNGKEPTITGAATSITSSNLTSNRALMSDGSGKVAASSVTSTELGYVSGVTSAIQTQINSKQATITGAATSITSSDLTANKALISDASGKVAVSSTSSTELGYVAGVTSAIQTQINGKQATITGAATSVTSSNLTASKVVVSDASGKIAAGSIDADKVVGTNAAQTLTNKTITLSTASRALVTDASKNIAESSVTSTELGYVSGVTSAIQTQLNGKQATITGAATTVTSSDLTASKVLVSNASGKIDAGSIDASKIVGTDSSQTLTNKTISGLDNTVRFYSTEILASKTLNLTTEGAAYVNASGVTLTMGTAPYAGYQYMIYTYYPLTLKWTTAGGTAVTKSIAAERQVRMTYRGSSKWIGEYSIVVTGTDSSNTDFTYYIPVRV